jgi:hypothetical protein
MPRKIKEVVELKPSEESETAPVIQKRTRYGRAVKKPVKYEPLEKVEDDYCKDEYNSSSDDESDIESESICSDDDVDESEYDNESDADDNGNLKDFVVYNEEEEEEEEELSDEDE